MKTSGSDAEGELLRLQAEFCKGIAHPKRLYILNLLKDGERSVSELSRSAGIPQANISQHLALMRQLGLVSGRRDGPNVYYRVSDTRIVEACTLVKEAIAERIRSRAALQLVA